MVFLDFGQEVWGLELFSNPKRERRREEKRGETRKEDRREGD